MKENTNSFLQYPVMSTLSPSYTRGPWYYKDVHLLAVTYQSTPEAIRAVVPRPLQPAESNRATLYWWRFTEVTGFGPYSEVAHSVACTFEGKPVSYIFQAFLDSESPTIAGREILGFPKKYGEPELKTVREVLTGTLGYGGVQVAVATMRYRAVDLSDRLAEIEQDMLQTPQLVLKLFPDVDNHTPKVAQLVRVNQYDVRVKGAIGVVELDRIDDVYEMRRRFVAAGAFVRPFGATVYLTPAFTIMPEELATLTDAVIRVVGELK